MELMISRILKYLNGCLDDDHMYRIGNFIIKNYTLIEIILWYHYLMQQNAVKKNSWTFVNILEYISFDEFKERLLADHQGRLEQIHARMLNTDINDFLEHVNTDYSKEEFIQWIDELCELIFNKQRIVILGALYPSSVAVDFHEADFNFIGEKELLKYQSF